MPKRKHQILLWLSVYQMVFSLFTFFVQNYPLPTHIIALLKLTTFSIKSGLGVITVACVLSKDWVWQLVPNFVQVLILFVSKSSKPAVAISLFLIRIILMLITFLSKRIFPNFNLPKISSTYSTGFDSFKILSSTSTNKPTFILIDVYYPTGQHRYRSRRELEKTWLNPSQEKKLFGSISRLLKIPEFFFTHLSSVKIFTPCYAPISTKKKSYPLLIFSSDIGLPASVYSTLAQNVASAGYIVGVLGHVDNDSLDLGAPKSQQEGKLLNEYLLKTTLFKNRSSSVGPISQRGFDSSTVLEYESFRRIQLRKRINDINNAYEYLKNGSQTEVVTLQNFIDWSMVSLAGHGLGAAAAAACCLSKKSKHPFFHNCLMISPWLDPVNDEILNRETTPLHNFYNIFKLSDVEGKPNIKTTAKKNPLTSFFLLATPEIINQRLKNSLRFLQLLHSSADNQTVFYWISRCSHLDFTDITLVSPLLFARVNRSGPRQPSRTLQITIRLMLNFLQRQYRESMFNVSCRFQRRLDKRKSNEQTNEQTNEQSCPEVSDEAAPLRISNPYVMNRALVLTGIPLNSITDSYEKFEKETNTEGISKYFDDEDSKNVLQVVVPF